MSEWTFEMNLWVNGCQEAGIVLLLGVVKRVAAGAGDQVDHTLGPGAGSAVENLIERPTALDL